MVEINRIMVNSMNVKHNNQTKKMMIAFYQRPYSIESIRKIKELLDTKKPNELLLLSIAERKKSSGTINSYLGRKDAEKLRDQYQKDQEIRSNQYAKEILKISKNKNITTKTSMKKGNIFRIIKNKIDEYQPDIIVINHSDKSKLDKIFSGCVEDEVVEKCKNNITVV